ncbi:MAG: ATP-binding cassette domain-containing protein [Caldisericota bacterium]|jgi:energy-coupling factor transport system ATP-binding protein|nr:ATP-binding cassette domain-containing protein [Caldisericota bacterium]
MPIVLTDVDYIYDSGEPIEFFALHGITLEIPDGEFVGIVGRTGSGKSTLVQHMNGLLLPSRGQVRVDDVAVINKRDVLAAVRRKIGIVFQYPEDQFFAETVYDEVAFGCRNYGFSKERVDSSVRSALSVVGMDDERFLLQSPFQLSGGEQRRVAIASVIAMEQKFVILDEPTAGLDSISKLSVLSELESLRQSRKVTVVLVSHNMDEVAEFCTSVIVLDKGSVVFSGSTDDFFGNPSLVSDAGLDLPESYRLAGALAGCGSLLHVERGSSSAVLESLRRTVSKLGSP